MGYRGTNARRQMQAMRNIMREAGTSATWKQYISAGGGNDLVGLGPTAYYRDMRITVVVGAQAIGRQPEMQTPVGQIGNGRLRVTCKHKVGRQDLLLWNGQTYEVDSDSLPNKIHGGYTFEITRRSE